MLYNFTKHFTIHINKEKITIYDSRFEKHKPIYLDLEESIEFRKRLNVLEKIFVNDDDLDIIIEKECEKLRDKTR